LVEKVQVKDLKPRSGDRKYETFAFK